MADVTKEDSSEFLVRHEKLDLGIYLSSSNLLLPHEETIPSRVSELEVSFRRDGVVRDPIIVDARSRVALDGMHRLAALRELRCFCVPVCAVDYLNPSIRVGVWYRTLSGRLSSDQFENALSSSGVEFERVPLDTTGIIENSQPAVLFLTRHIIPARPLGVNVPLMTLSDGTMPLQETNRQLFTSLRTRGITRRPSGTIIEGRRYDEETFVFN